MDSPMKKPIVAVFDFDGTLTYADSFLPFLRHQSGFLNFWIGTTLLSPFVLLQAIGVISNSKAKEKFLKFFLGGRKPEDLEAISQSFVKTRLPWLMNPDAIEKMEWHRREGHQLILLSASPELYLQHWTQANHFQGLLGTRLELSDGKITGRIDGKNCHGREKVERLKEHLNDLGDYEIYSYGDSRSDRHVLEFCAHPGFRSFGKGFGYRIQAMWSFLTCLV